MAERRPYTTKMAADYLGSQRPHPHPGRRVGGVRTVRLVMFRGKWHGYERIGGQPKRISLGTADRQVAARRLVDLEQGRRRKATTVAEMQRDYLADRGHRLASLETFQFAWKRLAPVFGHLRPDQIDRSLRHKGTPARHQRWIDSP
jgi:hypothetical protein